jgi:hypothetical protein
VYQRRILDHVTAAKWHPDVSVAIFPFVSKKNFCIHSNIMSVFVGRLPTFAGTRDLEKLLEKYGRIRKCDVKVWPILTM